MTQLRLRWFSQEFSPSGKQTALAQTCSRSRLKRHTRAVLLWGLLWTALLQLIPLVRLERTTEYPWHTIGTAYETRKWPKLRQRATEDSDHPFMLILGSSRICWALRTSVLDGMSDSDGNIWRAYNFGIPATGPIFELLYLREILAEGIRPRFALIEFNQTLMAEHRRGALNEEDMMHVECVSADRLLEWLPYSNHPEKPLSIWLGARLAPWYVFRRHIRLEVKNYVEHRIHPTYEAIDDWGWHIPLAKMWLPWERTRRVGLWRNGYYPALSNFRLGKKPTQALRELLDLCRREQIPAALVVMPESSQFRSWYSDEAKTTITGLLDELRQTYGVEVIDANCWLDDDDFEDGQHTLLHGAEVFTSRLAAELPRLLAQSQAGKSD